MQPQAGAVTTVLGTTTHGVAQTVTTASLATIRIPYLHPIGLVKRWKT